MKEEEFSNSGNYPFLVHIISYRYTYNRCLGSRSRAPLMHSMHDLYEHTLCGIIPFMQHHSKLHQDRLSYSSLTSFSQAYRPVACRCGGSVLLRVPD